ncbi:MAG: hypothetical protein ABIO16_11275 [Nocardioides sp.]
MKRALLAVLLLVGLALVAPAVGSAEPGAAKKKDDSWTGSNTIGRVFTNADGSTYAFPTYHVTVTADHTENLRSRQRVLISWKGAQPSGGRASNPYGENGLQQEYPVVVMQCRGADDPSLPPAQQLAPDTCWTASVAQRSQISRSDFEATWTHDLYAEPADKARTSGLTPFPGVDVCPAADIAPYFSHVTPFVTAKGQTFPACDSDHMPPEAAVGAAFPPAELAAFTDSDGNGSVLFEVRSDTENESLGCSDKVACSIVVIPIVGISCDQPATPSTTSDDACRRGGRFLPGSSNFANDGADQSVSPALWWSASNWRNRFSIPITFGLPPDACDILDDRPPTGFYGSELMAQAALQWAPAYCLDKHRFKFQLNQMSDEAGWNLMEGGDGAAAVVSSQHQVRGTDPVGYAPTAVTGFSIGYVIDKPDNKGDYTDLKLNPRLLAKLLTQSYLASDLGRGHPGMQDNPISLMNDPEFIKLNPKLSQTSQEAGATLLSLSTSSDVVEQLTEYIAQDQDAMAFVDGKADPWGMKVNPAYKKLTLPTPEWPLLDTYIPKTQNACREANPSVYFSQVAAPVTTLRKIAEALLDAWPNVQTRCDADLATGLWKIGRVDRQPYGSRFMLGITSLGDAARYGLRSAALETKPGTFVAPTETSLAAAVQLAQQKKPGEPFVIDQKDVRKDGHAYPGTMIVYTAAKLAGLDQGDADKVAQFVKVSIHEGQVLGGGNGELPEGYLPIKDKGVTKKLYDAAGEVGAQIAAQDAPTAGGRPTDPPTDQPTGGATPPLPTVPTPSSEPLPTDAPDQTEGPGTVPTKTKSPKPQQDPTASASPSASASEQAAPVDMPPTQLVSSGTAGGLLPALLLVGLVALAVSSALRAVVRRGR